MRYVKAVVLGVLTGVVATILWIGLLIARMALAMGTTGAGAISGGVGSIAYLASLDSSSVRSGCCEENRFVRFRFEWKP